MDRGLSMSVDLSKGIVVCHLLSFFVFFCGIHGSFYLTLICPLWDLFLNLRGNTLYITRVYEIFVTLQKYSYKEDITIMMQMYASARVAGYAMILARHVEMIRARPN